MGKLKVEPRDVSPFLQAFRNFLLGRSHTKALRFPADMASRSPPLPILPKGPSHKLFNNYYFSRDARDVVKPPRVLISGALQLDSGKKKTDSEAVKPLGPPTPGSVFKWD